MPGESEEVTLTIDLRDDITAALRRIEQRLEALDRQLEQSAATARQSGREIGEGLDEVEQHSDDAAAAQRRLREDVDETSGRVRRQRRDVDNDSSALDRLSKRLDKVGKSNRGFARTFALFKWPLMISGGIALANVLVSIAGGAIIAAGNLASVAGAVGPLAGLFLAAKLGMLVWKTAAEALKPQLDAIKEDWKDVGKQIAAGGLGAGIDDLRVKMSQFRQVTADGMTFVGSKIGNAASKLGDFLQQKDTLDIMGSIWEHVGRIIENLLDSMLTLLPGVLRMILAVLPSTERLSEMIERAATRMNNWMVEFYASGRAVEFFNRALDRAKRVGSALWAFLSGLVNIFRIAGSVTGDLTFTMENAAKRFEAWTNSADGQNSIRKFFEDVKPVVRELWLLLKDVLKLFLGIATDPAMAELIAQIRTELLPVVGELFSKLAGPDTDLLSSAVSALAAIGRVLAQIDPAGIVLIFDALAQLANGLAWCAENIPGFSFLISTILTLVVALGPVVWLGSKLVGVFRFLGPILKKTGVDSKDLSNTQTALRWVWQKLSDAGSKLWTKLKGLGGPSSFLSKVWSKLSTAAKSLWSGISKAGQFLKPIAGWIGKLFKGGGGLSSVFKVLGKILPWVFRIGGKAVLAMGGPIGWVIGIVWLLVDAFIWLYENCEWFRNLVDTVWAAIVDGAKWCWEKLVEFAEWAWEGIKKQLAAWDMWFKNNVVNPIVQAALKLWFFYIKPVWDKIVAGARKVGAFIAYFFKLGIYIAARILRKLIDTARAVWDRISSTVRVMKDSIAGQFRRLQELIVSAFRKVRDFFVNNIARPIREGARRMGMIIAYAFRVAVYIAARVLRILLDAAYWVWDKISAAASWVWEKVSTAFGYVRDFVLGVFRKIRDWWNEHVGGPVSEGAGWLSQKLAECWQFIVDTATAAWNWIYSNVIKPVVDFVVWAWNGVVGFLSWVWSMIVEAATAAWNWIYFNIIKPVVDWVKMAWNTVVGWLQYVWSLIVSAATVAWNWLYDNVIKPVADRVIGAYTGVRDFVVGVWRAISDWAAGMWDSIKRGAEGAANWVKDKFTSIKDSITGGIQSTWDRITGGIGAQPDVQIGGSTIQAPQAPQFWQGGYTGGQAGLVGELGPEPIVRGSKVLGMVGEGGPEFGQLPRGSHVVPTQGTLLDNPGLAKRLPASVAGAISRAMPGYGGLFGDTTSATRVPAEPGPSSSTGDRDTRRLAGAVGSLERTMRERPPPISVSGGASAEENRKMVRRELERYAARQAERARYDYGD